VLRPGPWTHRDISANGTRLHIAEMGDGPLVLLLHGFPEFWWSWRHQLPALAEAGFRVAAVDMRGYGASDKPPRGYDAFTLAADIAGLVRALGAADATLIGHDMGGFLGWVTAALHPQAVRRLAVLSMPHPLRWTRTVVRPGAGQLSASRHTLWFQLPWRPERLLVGDDSAFVAQLLHEWGGPRFPDPDYERVCRDAIRIPGAAHCSLEYFRWLVRSSVRPDGHRFRTAMARPVEAPTLHVQGMADPYTLPATALGSARYVTAAYDWLPLEGVGHFPHEEDPSAVNAALTGWLAAE
jgi:pimeloyl-ACP methyl ester carboxylesterase